jgi:hypothetical protein
MGKEAESSLGYLSDQETRVDLLNNEAIARTVVRLIREKIGPANHHRRARRTVIAEDLTGWG